MTFRLPPLTTLRAFEAVARLGSLTRAADELGRTHGAVSRQLRNLQDQAGISFFEKEGTSLRLNAHGRALQQLVSRSFAEMEAGWTSIMAEAREPALHIACSATFAMRWLVPHLAAFYKERPDVRIRLSMTSAREISLQGADLVLAWDRAAMPRSAAVDAIPLAPIAFGPVCADGYSYQRSNDSLRFQTRIDHAFTSRAWTHWQASSGLTIASDRELHFPHTHLCIEAAIAGLGVALVERRMVQADLDSGRLVAPFGFAPFPEAFCAVPVGARGRSQAADAFIRWLKGALAPPG